MNNFRTSINGVEIGVIFFENLNLYHVCLQKADECLIDIKISADKYPTFDAVVAHVRRLFSFLFKGKKVQTNFYYSAQFEGC